MQDLSTSSNAQKKETTKQMTTKSLTGANKIGERKNSAQGPPSQQILGGPGEVNSGHTIGRSTGVRGSVELKSIN
jgi:hypothetical protein